ncbi:hypothetical protein Tco_0889501 [Tanacetum coccineum]
MVLLGSVPELEVEAVLEFTNYGGKNLLMNFETRSSHVRIDRGGSCFSQSVFHLEGENGNASAYDILGSSGTYRRSDLLNNKDVSMRSSLSCPEELFV